MWLKFLLAILLLHATAGKEPEPQYVLMVPAVLQSDSPSQVCLQFFNLNQTISVRVVLEYDTINTTIFEKNTTASNGLQCLNFMIPPVISVPLAFISFTAKGTTFDLKERRSVMIWNMESFVFVQTDKPIYKPGQSVMFRVVALDFNFKPIHEMYPLIAVQDPQNNRIFQWQNVTSEINIVQIEFPLTEEPILGNYKIIVTKKSGERTNHSFLVEEYVLPKFDVTVTAPGSLTVMDSELTVKICAVISFVRFQLDTDGCLSHVLSSKVFELNRTGYKRNLDVKATVTEKGTDLQLTATQSISITQVMSSLQFENVDRYYRRGIPYFGQIKLVDKDNSPISNKVIQLFVNNKNTHNFTTDINGIAPFSIDTSKMFDPELSLKALYETSDQCHSEGWIEPSYPDASLSVQRLYSWTSSFVRIEPLWKDMSCGQKRMITVYYILNTEGYEHISIVNFYYVGMAKGKIVLTGEIKVNIQADQNGTFMIPLVVNEKMAPALRLLVYMLHPAKELVADSVRFSIQKCFKNKVQLQFSEKQMVTTSNVSLVIEAAANSFCAVRAVDKSVLLLKTETELSAETDMGMKFFTNSKIRQPIVCTSETVRPPSYFLNAGFTASTHHVKLSGSIGNSSTGKASVSYTIPDTITEWKASAFCVEELSGFGISAPATLTAFQPFFVDLTLPYSITHGEDFLLRANVFNYLNHCIKINVLLSASLDYQAKLISPEDDGCVCAKKRKSYVWNISPKGIGDVLFSITAETNDDEACEEEALRNVSIDYRDTQIRALLVEPEGIRREETQNSLICMKGDIMGTAMQNVHQLLQMPFGSGEQNMVLFAPNIYVLDYLDKTRQLSEDVKSKTIGYLVSGYQKQLSYKHPDGSYSTFGIRDKEGNTWLTAFVYKSFAEASRFIYIDDNVQAQTLIWLARKQKTDGCFQSAGILVNNAMKVGGVDNELSLSAYITIALLEAGHSLSHTVIRNAFYCLETASEKNISDIYTQALVAYAFCLAGKAEVCESFLRELQKSAKETDGSKYWEQKQRSQPEKSHLLDHVRSIDVEITSYVLLALLYKPNCSQEDLTKASAIVQWIIRQQNPYGGFASMQDTVVALQALAAYGAATYNSVTQNVIKINSKNTFEKVFTVNNENRLLLQQTPLPQVPGKYSLTVNGTGCVLIQTALRYNIHLPEGAFGFSLSVQTSNASCPGDQPGKFDIVLISSYTGKRSSSNMVIIDVKMLSGFVPVKSSLDKILQKRRKEVTFSVEQNFVVTHPKPAPVLIYDYYETASLKAYVFNVHRQYMVLLPFLIHTGSPEKICVQLTHLNESVTLSATLEYQGENRSLIDDVVTEKDVFTCIPYSLSESNSTSVALLTVTVKGETLQFRSRKSVLVKNSESLVFVQTDKPIYKPGQTVLFRIVSLDKDFHPLNEKFPFVYVQDPQRNRVYQWQGVELETGLTQLSFPLTSDPIQGSYKIVVQKNFISHVEHSFIVEEYVLPKYEVLVKLPKMITIEDKELPVSVCG
ncbi:hypothetical protein CIB84_000822, partial [Bambusicola thoracicus]